MRDDFILVMVGIAFLLALKSRVAGLLTYWWFGIFRPHDWVWGSLLTDLKLPLVAALLLIVPSTLQRKVPKVDNVITVLMLLMLGVLIVAELSNDCGDILRVRFITVPQLFILFYIVLLSIEIADDKKKIFWLILVISISIAAHSAKGGIHAFLTGSDNYGASNLTGLFSGSNAFALGTGMLLFFMIFSFQHINSPVLFGGAQKFYFKPIALKTYKMVFVIIILGSFYNIMSLQSRGSFIATCLGLLVWILLHKYRVRMLIILPIVITIGLNFAPMPDGYEDRIASAFADEEELDNSAASRPHFWRVAVSMVEAHPFGVGPGCYRGFYDRFDTSDGQFGHRRSVHSSHFQILSDAGYLGAFIWVLLFAVSFFKLCKIKVKEAKKIKDLPVRQFYIDISSMLLCAITVFLIGGAFYEYAFNDIIWLVFALVIAVEKSIKKDIVAKI